MELFGPVYPRDSRVWIRCRLLQASFMRRFSTLSLKILAIANHQLYKTLPSRTPVNCDTCRHVRQIDEVHVSELSWETFYSGWVVDIIPTISLLHSFLRYADIGRPLIIRNASLDWPIMSQLSFEWLKHAYLSDPEILDYDDKECWFNNYKSKHLGSLRSVFRLYLKSLLLHEHFV